MVLCVTACMSSVLCLAVAFLFEIGHAWVGQLMSLHMLFTQCWEGQMLVDGNKEMVEQLVQQQRHDWFLHEEVQHIGV